MTTYKIAKREDEKPDKYFTNLMKALNSKEYMKKIRRDGYLYHLYSMTPESGKWFKLD